MSTVVTVPTVPTDTVLQGARVLLRQWRPADRDAFAAMNANPDVMRHFVGTMSRTESDASSDRMVDHHARLGYGWWVLQTPELEFAGFVGLAEVPFDLPGLTGPHTQVGWRLLPSAWGRGLASEAAALCLDHAKAALGLPQVVSYTTLGNLKSIAVMQRIGMLEIGRFEHPRVPLGHPTRPHVLFSTR